MHYKNGREAKQGDVVLDLAGTIPVAGIFHSPQPGSTSCNGQMPMTGGGTYYVTVGECLAIEDIRAAAAKGLIRDISCGDESPIPALNRVPLAPPVLNENLNGGTGSAPTPQAQANPTLLTDGGTGIAPAPQTLGQESPHVTPPGYRT